MTIIPLGPALLTGSSSLPGGVGRAVLSLRLGRRRALRRSGDPRSGVPPYLALLRAGFCLPSALQQTRCALTAPFHHCPPLPLRASARQALRPTVGCVFSVPLSFELPRPGVTRHTALRSSDFPRAVAASTPSCEAALAAQARDRLVHYDGDLSLTSKF